MNKAPQAWPDPLQAIAAEPWRYDFFQALRLVEAHHADKPRLGTARKPSDEPLRLGQMPELSFAPSTISAVKPGRAGAPPRMEVRFFGLFGPNGPLPLHLSDHARERILHHGDETFARFADVFHHRMLLLFYRAWAQAQPTVSLDRPGQDRFADQVGSLIGVGGQAWRGRDEAPHHLKLFFAGHLSRQVRNAEGLESLLTAYLGEPVRIEPFVGHWMALPDSERTRIVRGGSLSSRLGSGVVLGGKVWDRQHKFRIHIGPLGLARYEALLPGGSALAGVKALVRQYVGLELAWDVRLHLRDEDKPRARPGAYGRLGWTTWIGRRGLPATPASTPPGASASAAPPASPARHPPPPLTLRPESWRPPRAGRAAASTSAVAAVAATTASGTAQGPA